MSSGSIDLLRHCRRIFFIAFTPQRYPGLEVSGEAGYGVAQRLPFTPIVAVDNCVAAVAGVIVGEIVTAEIDFHKEFPVVCFFIGYMLYYSINSLT